ncbi:MAG: amino acid permease [Candidatus Obscuribacterales bacterium]|nr:amino acid permease [Candidatus Obscuribacterales bacterium]
MSDRKILGKWDSVAISIGIVLGVGIFRVPSEVANHLSSGVWIIFAWVVGGIFSFFGALCYAELVSLFPKSGGDYVYLREAYGKVVGFLFAWSELLITRTGSVAAIALMFGEYLCALFSLDKVLIKPAALLVIVLLTLSNLTGLKQSSRVQNVLTVTKVSALILIIVAGALSAKAPATSFVMSDLSHPSYSVLMSVCLALVPILWTYGGWRDNVFLAGETKDAEKSVPFALLMTCVIITVIYSAMNLMYLWYIPADTMKTTPLIAAKLLEIVFGEAGAKLFEGLIVIYGLGVINGLLLTGGFLARAMSEDNPLFKYLEKTDERTGTPLRALIFNGIWSCVLVGTGTFEMLLYFTGLWVWIFFAMVAIAIIIFRTKKHMVEQRFHMPGYPVIPLIVAVVSLALAWSTFNYLPTESMWGTVIVLAGLPFFYFQKKNKDFAKLEHPP